MNKGQEEWDLDRMMSFLTQSTSRNELRPELSFKKLVDGSSIHLSTWQIDERVPTKTIDYHTYSLNQTNVKSIKPDHSLAAL